MTAADLIDRARRTRKFVGAVVLAFMPVFLAALVIKPWPGRGR